MTKQHTCISVADIHGNIVQYEKLKTLVASERFDSVFMCGDLLPKTGGSWHINNKVRTIAMQADFIENYFFSYLVELGKIADVYAIFGNDDFSSNYSMLAQAAIENVHFLNRQVKKMQVYGRDLYVAGYPYVGLTPFYHKDWERWDELPRSLPYKIYRTDGYISREGAHIPVDLYNDTQTIADDIRVLSRLSDPKDTVYIFHEAPFNTPLDQIASDNKYIKNGQLHIGSQAIRRFIKDKHPLLTMHGHIHETFAESGDFCWRNDASVSFTAANDFTSDMLAYIEFTLPNLGLIERKVV